MSRVIGQCNSMRQSATKFRQRFKTLALAISFGSLGLPFLTAYPQTISVVTQQEPLPDANAKVAFAPRTAAVDGARLPDLSSLDIPSLIRDCDRLGTAM